MKLMNNGKQFTQGGYTNSEKVNMMKNGENNMKAFLAERFPEIYGGKSEIVTTSKSTTSKRSKVCVIANRLAKQGMNRSAAFRRAWELVKTETVETKVAGVTVGRRQEALENLTKYDADLISVNLERDATNEYDRNAIKVIITVKGKGSYFMGFVPRTLAAMLAPLIDANKAVRATFKEVRGKYQSYHNYGMVMSLSI